MVFVHFKFRDDLSKKLYGEEEWIEWWTVGKNLEEVKKNVLEDKELNNEYEILYVGEYE